MSDDPAGDPAAENDQPVRFLPGGHPVPAPRPATLADADGEPLPEASRGEPPLDPTGARPPLDPTGERPTPDPADERPTPDPAGERPTSEPTGEWPEIEPTGEWPPPDPAGFAEEDTDPAGFAPVSGAPYPPATDPFDDPGFTSAYPLPGWTAPPDLEPLPGPARRRRPLLLAAAALGLAALVAAFLLVPRQDAGPSRAAAAATAPAQRTANPPADNAPGEPITAPAGDRTEASFDLVDSATVVELSAGDLGDDLFRISTPRDSGLTPAVDQDGDAVRLRLRSDGSGGSAVVTIVLSSAVRWTLRLDGGAAHSRLDLTDADLAALDLNGGASRIDLSLPEPRGVLPVRMTGGVDQFRVTLPDTTPVRVRVESGAGQVTVGGATHQGIAPGRAFTANGWDSTADDPRSTADDPGNTGPGSTATGPGSPRTGVDLQAVAGLASLTVLGRSRS
ncbi:hypothetical protein BJY16_004488 [Actinoplanes octamycinicus]|uniref:Uncharacterized protein n=1 Tax=Actinoplanes octamycinicus TaxID=135948 RepID=A0A7W7GZB7_9ACTN|nr:hypothetical protein [Actinoplanes octamycinicus]MBB4741029.1 hypothetical protein [Actinoplanes octamycinicus]GIE55934.1 hypothetical protein Aoc01nite_13360 [Actinoplanes octamycinicus]